MNTQYSRNHQNRTNLILHIFAVPIFVLCAIAVLVFLIQGKFLLVIVSFVGVTISLAVQGYGHKLEKVATEPFDGAIDFILRIFLEQFYKFWVFFFSGEWFKALKKL